MQFYQDEILENAKSPIVTKSRSVVAWGPEGKGRVDFEGTQGNLWE